MKAEATSPIIEYLIITVSMYQKYLINVKIAELYGSTFHWPGRVPLLPQQESPHGGARPRLLVLLQERAPARGQIQKL